MQAKRAYLANPDFPPVEIVRQRVGTPTRCFWFSNNFNGGFFMNSQHLVGGLGMTTTGEQVTVIVYVTKSSASPTTCMLNISTRLTVIASWLQ